jgi:type 1 glutamine amidotransferase
MKIVKSKFKMLLILLVVFNSINSLAQKYEVLIVTGQNNHYWQGSSKIVAKTFNNSDLFNATVIVSPSKGEDMSEFSPKFKKYDLVCLDYNGDYWSDKTQNKFVKFVKKGGGLVVFHASDNSFPKWKEFNEMIGLGGWGNRTEKDGPYVYWKNGEFVRDNSPGRGGSHGEQEDFVVRTRNSEHPIMKGLPSVWMHSKDELYHSLRGPANNMTVLATASQKKESGGSGRQEPMLMTINYGKGRVFHSVLGHTGKNSLNSVKCAGFITTLLRGAEWVVTGDVTQAISSDFPNAKAVTLWEGLEAPDAN